MDHSKNPRPAKKRNRIHTGTYITTPMKIDQLILAEARKQFENWPGQNFSEYVEKITTPFLPPKGTRERKWKTYPARLCLIFTEDYHKELKKIKNVSLAVEELLVKALKIK